MKWKTLIIFTLILCSIIGAASAAEDIGHNLDDSDFKSTNSEDLSNPISVDSADDDYSQLKTSDDSTSLKEDNDIETSPETNKTDSSNVQTTSAPKITKKSVKITASPATKHFKKSEKFKAVIKNQADSSPISGAKVVLKVYTGKKYKTYNLKTNSKGEVSINTKSLSKGTHKVIIKVKATSKYKANSEKSSIKIVKSKIATHFKLESISNKYAYNGVFEGVWMEIKLYDSSGKEVGFKDIKAQIKKVEDNSPYGEQYTFMSNTGEHEVLCRSTGYPCYLQVDFAGDDVYKPCTFKYNL